MGSASKNSFRVSFGNTMKKIREAPAGDDGTMTPTVQGTPKKGRKKRAADQEDVEGESPKKKKMTPKKSKAKRKHIHRAPTMHPGPILISFVESEVEAEDKVKPEPMDEEPEQVEDKVKPEPMDEEPEQSEGEAPIV